MTTTPAELIFESRARFELLKRQDQALGGKEIAEIHAGSGVEHAKLVVNLKGAAQWTVEYGERLAATLEAGPTEPAKAWEAGFRTGLANHSTGLRPGVFRCPKCGLRSVTVNMDVATGNTEGAQTANCPNECGPAWPVTWKDDCHSAERELEETCKKLAALEAAEAEREVHPEVIARVQLAMRNRERPFDSDIAALIIACGWQPDPAAGAGTSKEGAPPMSLQAIAESVGYTGDLSAPYIPTPIFFEDTGILSYIMADIPAVTRQMDTNFDLLLDMTTREPVGFNLYGAKRAFPQPTQGSSDYVLAPKTASEAMITAAINEGDNANTNLTTEEYLAIVYRAMISASTPTDGEQQ